MVVQTTQCQRPLSMPQVPTHYTRDGWWMIPKYWQKIWWRLLKCWRVSLTVHGGCLQILGAILCRRPSRGVIDMVRCPWQSHAKQKNGWLGALVMAGKRPHAQ